MASSSHVITEDEDVVVVEVVVVAVELALTEATSILLSVASDIKRLNQPDFVTGDVGGSSSFFC